jgi:hypothetical protein
MAKAAAKKPMGRPPKPDKERLDVLSLRLNAVLVAQIERAASEMRVGKTTAARMLIEAALAARGKGKRV